MTGGAEGWGLVATAIVAGLLFALAGSLWGARRERRRRPWPADPEIERDLTTSLVESVSDAVLLWDIEGRIVYASGPAERMFALPATAFLGESLARVLDADGHREVEKVVERFRRRGELQRSGRPMGVACRRGDGRRFPAEVVVTPQRWEGSARFVGVFRDQSERERARELEQRSESLRGLIDQLPDALRVQRDRRLLYVSRRFLDFVGCREPEEVIGHDISNFLHPDDRSFAQAREQAVVGLGKAVELGEQRLLRRDGSLTRTESVGVAIVFDGEPAMAVVARDLDERERADARFRMAVESAPNGMVMVDSEGRIVLVNREAERLFGYVREELEGQPVEILVPGRFRPHHAEHRRRFFSAPETRRRGRGRDLFGLHRDGTEIPVEIGLNPIETDEGLFVLSAVVDIRERVSLREQLHVSDRLAVVGTLSAGVAHGINNPLAYISANLDFLQQEMPRLTAGCSAVEEGSIQEADSALEQAKEGTSRIRDLVADLLTFARGGDGGIVRVDVRVVLESVLTMLRTEIRHSARLETEWGDVPPVAADESKLAHVFMNVVGNAAQAIPEGRAEENCIRIVTRRGGTDEVLVEVHDTGSGIAEVDRSHVFEPFYTTKPVGHGTGLGLSVAHGILSGLGGWIELERSPDGRGTVLRMGLPTFHGAEQDGESSPPELRAGPARLLVVDDEEAVLAGLYRMLRREHVVTLAQDAGEALTALARERFDAILLDLMMPDVTGIELFERLSRERPEVAERVIFMTGGAFTEEARLFVAGREKYTLRKPFDRTELRRMLQRLDAGSGTRKA